MDCRHHLISAVCFFEDGIRMKTAKKNAQMFGIRGRSKSSCSLIACAQRYRVKVLGTLLIWVQGANRKSFETGAIDPVSRTHLNKFGKIISLILSALTIYTLDLFNQCQYSLDHILVKLNITYSMFVSRAAYLSSPRLSEYWLRLLKDRLTDLQFPLNHTCWSIRHLHAGYLHCIVLRCYKWSSYPQPCE